MTTHFKGKDAIGHVAETQARGVISAAEIHGIETPGWITAGADAARDTAIILLLFYPFLPLPYLLCFFLGFVIWKGGRGALLGWARLERLHRVLEQEKWEIEHNRPQERAELKELYLAKGFEGKLLEDVVDVLMADGDRLLRVMIEEEMGLSLENIEHPLKQALGAGLGALIASILIGIPLYFGFLIPYFILSILVIGFASSLLAHYAQNKIIPTITWNVSLGLLCFGVSYYTLQLLK